MSLTGKRVMLADDEKDIVAVLKMMLERWNCTVDAFSDPLAALEAFKSQPCDYDLIVTDIRMPGMNGIELAKNLSAIRPNSIILFISAFDLDQQIYGAFPGGKIAEDFLRKPIIRTVLCEAVNAKLGSPTA
jgi:CheY-like chemotaxis protein